MSSSPQMATAPMIEAFRLLDTNHARQDAIEALLEELTNHELRHLKDITAAKTFHFDIIGHLPVELVAHIFAYLDTSTPYRLQRVSRQWRHVLQSPVVVKQSLIRWYGPDLDLRQGGYTFFERKAKHLHAFRHGKPKLYLRIRRDDLNSDVEPILAEHTLIWKHTPQENILYLLDIQAWELFTLVGDAREVVVHFFASSHIVGFVTSGTTVYVSDLKGRGKKKFRLPNATMNKSISCRESTVACAALCEDYLLIFIWDYSDQRGRSFTIDFGSDFLCYAPSVVLQLELALLLQPKDKRIIIFVESPWAGTDTEDDLQWRVSQDHILRYTTYTYAGGHAFGTRVAGLGACHLEGSQLDPGCKRFVPLDHWGTFRIKITGLSDHNRIRWVQFDENTFKFTRPQPITHPNQLEAREFIHRWGDIFISRSTSPFPILTHLGPSECPVNKPLLVQELNANGHAYDSFIQSSVLLNERYAVVMSKYGLYILCYETNPRYPTESGPFFNLGQVLEAVDLEVYKEKTLKTD